MCIKNSHTQRQTQTTKYQLVSLTKHNIISWWYIVLFHSTSSSNYCLNKIETLYWQPFHSRFLKSWTFCILSQFLAMKGKHTSNIIAPTYNNSGNISSNTFHNNFISKTNTGLMLHLNLICYLFQDLWWRMNNWKRWVNMVL